MTTKLSPILRWAGSKRKLLPHILPLVPKETITYIEPFAGSCCVFLALRPKRAILSDLNSALVDTYKTVRRLPADVYERVSSMPGHEDFYYALRETIPEDLSPVDRAARFVYLNRHCFNGVYRTNKCGHFNVPRGTKAGVIPSRDEFCAFARAMKSAKLRAVDFERSVNEAQSGDFVYLDPPYSRENGRFRGEYGYGSFCDEDIGRLIASANAAASRGAIVLLSFNSTIRHMLPNWHSTDLMVRRSVAGFNHKRAVVKESLYSTHPLWS